MAYRGLETLKCRLLAPLASPAAQRTVIIQCTEDDDKDGLMNKDEYKDKDKYNCKAKDTERQTNDKNTDILGTIGHWVKIANCLQQQYFTLCGTAGRQVAFW